VYVGGRVLCAELWPEFILTLEEKGLNLRRDMVVQKQIDGRLKSPDVP
jgi:hypothetical protein